MSVQGANIEEPAYLKMMLHAAKYPWAVVNGFLLGTNAKGDKVVVEDAAPLFHTSTLAPLLETSASMVEAHANKKGLTIVGYYQAQQRLDDNTPSVLGGKIMDKIDSRHEGGTVLLVINNKRLEKAGDHALSGYTRDSNDAFRRQVDVKVPSAAVGAFESALARQAEAEIVDMDEHLDDIAKDWRNTHIAAS